MPSQALPSDTSQSIQADVLEALGSIRSGSPAAISRLLIVYVALLATNLIAHWIANVMFNEQTPINVHQLTIFTLITEVIDTLIVVMGLALIPRPPKISAWCKRRAFGWLAGIAVLTLALGLNLLYHSLIQNYVQFPKWAHERTMMPLAWGILLVCIQPGVVEELFFRYIALGNLSREMNTVGAVLVSSVMFGMAHSGVFLSIPILTVVGIGFAIARLASGSIVLPMILHALHNGVALYLESTR